MLDKIYPNNCKRQRACSKEAFKKKKNHQLKEDEIFEGHTYLLISFQ
jgi:hypothetical protein